MPAHKKKHISNLIEWQKYCWKMSAKKKGKIKNRYR